MIETCLTIENGTIVTPTVTTKIKGLDKDKLRQMIL